MIINDSMEDAVESVAKMLENQTKNIKIEKVPSYGSSVSRPYTTILVDNKHTLSIELRDDTKSDVEEAIGRAIYSTTAISIADAYFKFNSVQNPVFAPVSERIPPKHE